MLHVQKKIQQYDSWYDLYPHMVIWLIEDTPESPPIFIHPIRHSYSRDRHDKTWNQYVYTIQNHIIRPPLSSRELKLSLRKNYLPYDKQKEDGSWVEHKAEGHGRELLEKLDHMFYSYMSFLYTNEKS